MSAPKPLNQPEPSGTAVVSRQPAVHLETWPLSLDRILLVLNDPPRSRAAARAAAMMAQMFGGKIEVVHVLARTSRHGAMGAPDEAQAAAETEDSNRDFELLSRDPSWRNVSITHSMERGALADTLLALAAQRHFDLVILGDPSEGMLKRVTRGSPAELLARRLGVPGLLLGPHAQVAREWNSILLATALVSDSLRPAQYAVSIAQQLQCDVTVEHVLPYDPWLTETMRADVRASAQRQLEELLPEDAAQWCRPHVSVPQGDIAGNILETATRTDANLIVVGLAPSIGRSDRNLGTVLGDIMREAPCPVLVVPAHLH